MVDCGAGFVPEKDVLNESRMFSVHRCMDADAQTVFKYSGPSVYAEQNPFPGGNHCASYDPTAPTGYKMCNRNAQPEEERKRPEDLMLMFNKLKSFCDSPIYLAHELLRYQNKTIDYDLISVNGQVHCPEFMLRAKCDDIVVYGNGRSKKEAKKNAATMFLNQYLGNVNLGNGITSNTLESKSSVSSNTSQSLIIDHENKNVLEAKSEANPIGALQELCMARCWQLPEYKCIKTEFSDHNCHNYIMQCSLQKHTSRGKGKTKQVAKRQAAHSMYEKIIGLFQEQSMSSSVEETQNMCENEIPSVALLNNKSIQDMIKLNVSDTLNCIDLFFNQLKLSTNPYINNLKNFNYISEFNTTSVDVLSKIGDEEGFDVTYVKIAKKTEKSEVLVQVSIIPLLVNIGTGNTMEEAQELAAYSALSYLKLLLDK